MALDEASQGMSVDGDRDQVRTISHLISSPAELRTARETEKEQMVRLEKTEFQERQKKEESQEAYVLNTFNIQYSVQPSQQPSEVHIRSLTL